MHRHKSSRIAIRKYIFLVILILAVSQTITCSILRTTAVPIHTIRIENTNIENLFRPETQVGSLRAEWRGSRINIISQPNTGASGDLVISFASTDDYNYALQSDNVTSSVGNVFSVKRFTNVRWEDIEDPANVNGKDLVLVVSANDPQYRDMVYIPGGTFKMGSKFRKDENPIRRVTVDGFYMDKYEVTVRQFRQFCQATRSPMPKQPFWNDETHPVVNVTWEDANRYAKWAGKRLPSEAEWEYAARSGSFGLYYDWGNVRPFRKQGGNIADEALRTEKRFWRIWKGYYDGFVYTAPVGSFFSNRFGLHDMTGNVLEWCADWYDENYYKNGPNQNPRGPKKTTHRVIRGGAWNFSPHDVLTTRRFHYRPDVALDHLGFRCVKER